MQPTKQTVFHDPDNGIYGNCFSAVIASILHLPIEEVPIFVGEDQAKKANKWLRQFGLAYIIFDDQLPTHISHLGIEGLYHDAGGSTERFVDVLHACVAKDFKVIFDPHPSDAGLKDISSFGIIISLEPWHFIDKKAEISKLHAQLTELQDKYNNLYNSLPAYWYKGGVKHYRSYEDYVDD